MNHRRSASIDPGPASVLTWKRPAMVAAKMRAGSAHGDPQTCRATDDSLPSRPQTPEAW